MITKYLPTLFSAASLASAGLLQRGESCNADDCASAVNANGHEADCSSFFSYTAYPVTTATVTDKPKSTTVYHTITTDTITDVLTATTTLFLHTTDVESYISPAAAADRKREAGNGVSATVIVAPTAVPSYASACSGTGGYSSACSCRGVAKTTFASSSTFTHTLTVTAAPAVETVGREATQTVTDYNTVFVDAPLYTDYIPCGETLENGQVKIICEAGLAAGQADMSFTAADFDDCLNSFTIDYEHTDTNAFSYDLGTKLCSISGQQGPNSVPGQNVVYGYLVE